MRPLPRHAEELERFARAAKLSCPRGRALYLCNRIRNGGTSCLYVGLDQPGMQFPQADLEASIIRHLRKIRPKTAERWLAHWNTGGHIKALRSVAEENRLRRVRDQRLRDSRRGV